MTAPAVYVPADSTALALGADAVAAAVAAESARRGVAVRVVRNSSRGAFWLEPLVEVDGPSGRLAFGAVSAADVPGLFEAGFLAGGKHRLALGPVTAIPWLARQDRLVFARAGLDDPLSPEAYLAAGGTAGLRRALALPPAAVVSQIADAGLRGRGGAAFPAAVKWRTVLETPAARKVVVCNADEGDSGTFADRMVMEGDPFALLEGMAIAGTAVGAERGIVYVRAEYPQARAALLRAVEIATAQGWLGGDVLGSGRAFRVDIFQGAGAYVCGEETALLESLEGKRGMVRAKPPVPAVAGLHGLPTLVHNVLTLATVPAILAHGPEAHGRRGTGRSRGTQAFQLAGNVRRGGLVEAPFGLSLRELVEGFGGGTESGRPIRAVQVGGPLGSWFPASQLDLPLDYESVAAAGGALGHGGVVVFDDTVDMARMARHAMAFCARESCGKCTPCRIGSTRGVELLDAIRREGPGGGRMELLRDLCATLAGASLCALGGMTPGPVLSALQHFPEDFGPRGAGGEP
ncbi:MAG: SLBB domain-containing protein [Deltaproteobacteria bacterium]|nr:SLBB domain-containing protein [Deltaproteobacteria bacterium]